MDEEDQEVVIPVISEELHADAVPVVTGGVRVTKRLESHDEIIEQALRKSHVEVKRVKTERVVDGPQPARRVGKTLIVPVVSEVLEIKKQWVVTEEIHIIETEAQETVQNRITLNREEAEVERVDAAGNVIAPVNDSTNDSTEIPNKPPEAASILRRPGITPSPSETRTRPQSILKKRGRESE
jgi:stress response protein YsnF